MSINWEEATWTIFFQIHQTSHKIIQNTRQMLFSVLMSLYFLRYDETSDLK